MSDTITDQLTTLFIDQFGTTPTIIAAMPQSGSYRQYYRISSEENTVIGAFNSDIKENNAYLSFTLSLLKEQVPVPKVICVSKNQQYYLLEDLGNTTLFSFLKTGAPQKEKTHIYKTIVDHLLKIQFNAHQSIDYTKCYPRESFDEQSIRWDLNYFKYDFLKFLKIDFDEQLLENDFNNIIQKASAIPTDTFLYRDFQSSNIMIKEGQPYFIDFQGGRKGSFYYDLASLLFDAKANLSNTTRTEIKEYYFQQLQQYKEIEKDEFEENLTLFTLIRIMQAMGAYGFRGLHERKVQFIKSIPLAITNLKYITEHFAKALSTPELDQVFQQLFSHNEFAIEKKPAEKLTITITSFSFLKGIPQDNSGNGGGYVFDCRGLPNPGRYPEYKSVNGKDQVVIDFFKERPVIQEFIDNICKTVDITVKDYIKLKRTHLMVNFGCTGGQHRSVYCAENFLRFLKKYPDINIQLKHIEQGNVKRTS